jgi:tetratricopeptide (TPR) repeat protein
MKTLQNLIAAGMLLFVITISAHAQTNDAQMLVKQGIQLHDQGKYPEAIDKYQQALKLEPHNMQAEFELAFSMYSSGKGNDAIPHLEKIIKDPTDVALAAQASDILGSIYDDTQQTDKAIDAYQQGIKLNPKYQRLRYNLSLALLRQSKVTEAAASAIEAIKLDPRHASSQQVYAIALQNQGKDVYALMAYCSFLMLEPQTKRSVTDNQQIQNIIASKYKITGDKSVSVFVKDEKDQDAFTLGTALSLSAAASLEKKNLSQFDILQDELSTVFKVAGELSAKKKDKDFFWTFYVDYFYKLAQSNNMPAFTRLITLAANQQDNLQWFKDNPDKLKALDDWIKNTGRPF